MRAGIAVACAAVGLVALPALVASQSLAPVWWLLAEVLLSIAILALLPALGRALGDAIGIHARETSSVTASQTRLIGQLLVLGVMLIAVQAMLRRPLALTLNGDGRTALTFESAVAAIALTLVLALGVWLFQAGRPVVQTLTLRAIDAAIPTVGAAQVLEPSPGSTVVDGEATVLAPRRPSERAATIAETAAADTIIARDGDTTIIDDAEATVAADPNATLRLSHPPQ